MSIKYKNKYVFYVFVVFGVSLLANFAFSQQFTSTRDTLNLGVIDPGLISAYLNIKIDKAWEEIEKRNPSFSSIKIGIIDSGMDSNHPEFQNVNLGNTPSSAKFDHDPTGHGTQVAGIIGANNISADGPTNYRPPQTNGLLSGSKNLNYTIEHRHDGGPSLVGVVLDIFYLAALQGADAVNMSFSISNQTCNLVSTKFAEGIFFAVLGAFPNTLFVTSAGETTPAVSNAECFIPGALGGGPLSLPNVINVGGLDSTGENRWPGSPFGSAVNISAPAENVYAPRPPLAGEAEGQYDKFFGGTSASAPMVSGVAGLIKAIKPGLTPAQIKDILVRNADPITTDKPIGGRLNALKAVCDPMVLDCTPTPPPAFLQLTNTAFPARNFSPTISRDGTKIAFYSEANLAGLNPALATAFFVMNSDGTGLKRIAPNLIFYWGAPPSLNFDGSRVAFYAYTFLGENAIYVANTDGSPPTKLISVNTGGVVMSGDGSTIAYSSSSNHTMKIFAMNSDGTNSRLLVEGSTVGSFVISGNGARIAFAFAQSLVTPPYTDCIDISSCWQAGVINTDGTSPVILNPTFRAGVNQAISEDGLKIAFAPAGSAYPADIYLANADGTNLRVLLTVPFTGVGPVQFTADGSRLMYDAQGAVFLVNTDGSGAPQQVTPFLSSAGPAVSGDGRKIVFFSEGNLTGQNSDGNLEIFLANVP